MCNLFIVKQIMFCTQGVVNNFLITFDVFNKKKCDMSKLHGKGVWGMPDTSFLITAIACKAEGAAHIY